MERTFLRNGAPIFTQWSARFYATEHQLLRTLRILRNGDSYQIRFARAAKHQLEMKVMKNNTHSSGFVADTFYSAWNSGKIAKDALSALQNVSLETSVPEEKLAIERILYAVRRGRIDVA